jgi:peptidoglycan/LPS O-acetylase OafA/YrhL
MVFCLVGIVVSVALRNLPWIQHWNEVYPNLIYRFTPFHVDGLLFGAVLAMMLPRYGGREGLGKPFVALFWVTAAAVAYLTWTPDPDLSLITRVGYSVFALFFGSLIWLCVAPFGSSLARRMFSSRPLVQLGKYSYFIYVFHMLFFYYVRILGAHFIHGYNTAHPYRTRILMGCVTFVLTYLAAVISWKIFEGPILTNKRHFIYRYLHREAVGYTPAAQ